MTKHPSEYDPVVAARISPDLKEKLISKHPNNGDISRLIKALLERYIQGKIIGICIAKKA